YTPLSLLFNDSSPTHIYTLSLHDALPIYCPTNGSRKLRSDIALGARRAKTMSLTCGSRGIERLAISPFTSMKNWTLVFSTGFRRSEEHTSELQSRFDLVCRLLLEKKKIKI